MPNPNQALRALFRPSVKLPALPKSRGIMGTYGDSDDPYAYDPVQGYFGAMQLYEDRVTSYTLYEELDTIEDISIILDAHAEEAAQPERETGKTIWIEGKNAKVVKELTTLFDRIDAEQISVPICRDVAKQGDDFAEVLATKEDGVVSLIWHDPRRIERKEDPRGFLDGFIIHRGRSDAVVGASGDEVPKAKPWDVIHFRRYKQKRTNHGRNVYGTSLLWRSQKPGRRVDQLRDILMLYRITNTLDRRIYKVDVGAEASPEEAMEMLRRWKRALRRKVYRNPTTGEYKVFYDTMHPVEDVFWPTHKNDQGGVDIIPGTANINALMDMDHFIAALYGTMRAPPSYFGHESRSGSVMESNKSLSHQDIRWARAVAFTQASVKQGFTRLCQIHLAYKGMETSTENFKVMMVPPSQLEVLQWLEVQQTIVDVADNMSRLAETLRLNEDAWRDHILRKVLGLNDREIKKLTAPGSSDAIDAPETPYREEGEEPRSLTEEMARNIGLTLGAHPHELPKYADLTDKLYLVGEEVRAS